MRILVTAVWLDPDSTSEGICTAKFLRALAERGHEVICLTSQHDLARTDSVQLTRMQRLLPGVTIKHIEPLDASTPSAQGADHISATRTTSGWTKRKLGALVATGTGLNLDGWKDLLLWQSALTTLIQHARPDFIVARGAGSNFSPHHALLRSRTRTPWVANYHDPFPPSLYPAPYTAHRSAIQRQLEAIHERILLCANALSFPSKRLANWICGDRIELSRKSIVLPHVADRPFAPQTEVNDRSGRGFVLLHAGTLLRQRAADVLLEAFARFLDGDPLRHAESQLQLIGPIHSELNSDRRQALEATGNLVVADARVPYDQVMAIAKDATALILLEAPATESPFLPAKLADYLWLQKPVVALSPTFSATRDLLGSDYQLAANPDDVNGILLALEVLWQNWRTESLSKISPPAEALRELSPSTTVQRLETIAQALKPRLGYE